MAKTHSYPESVNRLIDRLATLPGIGRRTASRLAFHILKADPEESLALAQAIEDVNRNVLHCSTCFHLTEDDPCLICRDKHRDHRKILIVEEPKDVINLEETGAYDGTYHVLMGHLSPLEGITSEDLTLTALFERVQRLSNQTDLQPDGSPAIVEVILGMNPNLEGDGTSVYIANHLSAMPGVRVSRLARGIPVGSQIEYANKAVLSDAIHGRQSIDY